MFGPGVILEILPFLNEYRQNGLFKGRLCSIDRSIFHYFYLAYIQKQNPSIKKELTTEFCFRKYKILSNRLNLF